MSKEQQELLDGVYVYYCKSFENQTLIEEYSFDTDPMTQFMFIDKCKTDQVFSEKWGLTIEERELSLKERYDWFIKTYNTNLTRSSNQYNMEDILSSNNCPNKLITITYQDQTIESYE
jgi:hypothetical protein